MLQLRLTRAQRVFGTWPDGIKSIEYKELYSFGDAWKGCSLPFALIFLVTFRLRFCSTDCSVHNINARSERGATEELLTVLWCGRAGRGSGTAKLVKGMEGLSYKELLSKTGSLSIWKVGDWRRTGQRSLNLWAELGGQIRTNFPVFLKSRMKRHQMKLMGDRFNSSKAATDFLPSVLVISGTPQTEMLQTLKVLDMKRDQWRSGSEIKNFIRSIEIWDIIWKRPGLGSLWTLRRWRQGEYVGENITYACSGLIHFPRHAVWAHQEIWYQDK